LVRRPKRKKIHKGQSVKFDDWGVVRVLAAGHMVATPAPTKRLTTPTSGNVPFEKTINKQVYIKLRSGQQPVSL